MLRLMTKGIQLIKNHNPDVVLRIMNLTWLFTGREVFVQALVMPGYE
jgi:hypothetical protein